MAILDRIQTFSTFAHEGVFQPSIGLTGCLRTADDPLNDLCSVIEKCSCSKALTAAEPVQQLL